MTKKKKAHEWAIGNNQRQFETPHSTKSIAYWLSQYSKDGIMFVRTSLMLMYHQQAPDERDGSVRHRNKRGFSAATRGLTHLAKKCIRNQQLTSAELNDARDKLKNHHLTQLQKLWNRRYDKRKAA